MQSEGILRLVTWPAWFLLLCSVALLIGGFVRAFAGEFRRYASRRDREKALPRKRRTSS